MSECQRIDSFVTPFVDGELPSSDRDAVAQHLRVCPPCASRVAAERAVRDLIHEHRPALGCSHAPPSLQRACARLAASRGHLQTSEGAPRAAERPADLRPADAGVFSASRARDTWRTRLTPFALAASLVLVVAGAFLYQATERSARVMAAELTADHLKCLAVNSVLGTRHAPDAVESAMLSGFDWQMHLPGNPERAGLELVGARPCLYGEGKVAHIMYTHEGRPVSLFMLPNAARSDEIVKVLGHEAAIWCVGRRTFVLIARESRQDVERMASFVQAGLQ